MKIPSHCSSPPGCWPTIHGNVKQKRVENGWTRIHKDEQFEMMEATIHHVLYLKLATNLVFKKVFFKNVELCKLVMFHA